MSSNEMTLVGGESHLPATADDVLNHIRIIDEVKRKVMKKDVHFGTIPGCGDKPALLKPGAEKICLTFRLTHEFEIEVIDFEGGHKQYTVMCRLRYRDGTLVGQGIGICSTMENKYRFRWDNTGVEVPREYWEDRDVDLLGGYQYAPRKVGGKWTIFRRVEYDNPADYYNTCAKMAKKRAHVDATLSATAASDIFEQGEDDIPPRGDEAPDVPTSGKPKTAAPRSNGNGSKTATPKQIGLIRAKLNESGIPEAAFFEHFTVGDFEELPFDKVNEALAFIKDNAP